MSNLPYAISQRISNEASQRFVGKPYAEFKITAYIIGAQKEATTAQAYLEEIYCLWSVISEYLMLSEEGNPAPHPSCFLQYIRALNLKDKREQPKVERVR